MAVFVTMTVRPPDTTKFEAAAKESFAQGLPAGCTSQFWGRLEEDPGIYIVAGEWESHGAMHKFSDEVGPKFNAAAGTEGAAWETQVFEIHG